jgi:hypothetical protein
VKGSKKKKEEKGKEIGISTILPQGLHFLEKVHSGVNMFVSELEI